MTKVPRKLEVGDLQEDIQQVKQVASGNFPPVALVLIHLSRILEELGEMQYPDSKLGPPEQS